jgi:hypothetical protein
MELPDHFLEAHLNEHKKGADAVLGLILPHRNIKDCPVFEQFHAFQLENFRLSVSKGNPVRGVHVCTGNFSVDRKKFMEVGGFDLSLARSEDRELGIRLEKAGSKLVFCEHAYSIHQSDHDDLKTWMQRAYNYGFYDSIISSKHPELEIADPWRFFFLVSPVSRPLLLISIGSPLLGSAISNIVITISQRVNDLGLSNLAIKGTTLTYGLKYFAGMRTQAGTLASSIKRLYKFSTQKRKHNQ